MVGKKFLKSSVNWTALAERVPEHQKNQFVSFKSRSDAYLRNVQNLPETLPAIDWNYYKDRIGIPGLLEDFEKQYGEIKVPYPPDNISQKIDILEKDTKENIEKFRNESNARIAEYKKQLAYIDSLVPYNEMTMEDFRDAFPEEAIDPINKPTFWPHIPNEQIGYEERLEAERAEQLAAERAEKEQAQKEKQMAEAQTSGEVKKDKKFKKKY